MTKTDDFEVDVRGGYYGWIQDQRWLNRKDPAVQDLLLDTWHDDFIAYLILQGVPDQYASRVASCAYEQSHSGGYGEVLNSAQDLIEIFKTP